MADAHTSSKIGKIQVRVQTEERLYAINKLASAIEQLARALSTGTSVYVNGCTINGSPGIEIDTATKVDRTEIVTDENV